MAFKNEGTDYTYHIIHETEDADLNLIMTNKKGNSNIYFFI